MDILSQIQTDLLSPNTVLSDVLRKAKVLAYQIESTDLKNWVNQELDGYKDDLPDYRILTVTCFGKWTNGAWMVSGRLVPMHLITNEKMKEFLTRYRVFDGVKYIEELTKREDGHFILPADIVGAVNRYVKENGYGYMEIEYAVTPHDFEQILDTVRNRLLDFILELSENWKMQESLPSKDLLNNLVSVYIYNNQSQGGQMSTVFDQRGQQVNNQYNAGGNIKINIDDKSDFIDEIEKLKLQIEQVKNSEGLNQDIAIEAEYHLLQANKEVQKPNPNKGIFIEHIEKAKVVLSDIAVVANLVLALSKIVEAAQQFFK